jgi:hypothetical protein
MNLRVISAGSDEDGCESGVEPAAAATLEGSFE